MKLEPIKQWTGQWTGLMSVWFQFHWPVLRRVSETGTNQTMDRTVDRTIVCLVPVSLARCYGGSVKLEPIKQWTGLSHDTCGAAAALNTQCQISLSHESIKAIAHSEMMLKEL